MTDKKQLDMLYILGDLIELTLDIAQAEHTREDLHYLSSKFDILKSGVEYDLPRTF